MSTALVGQVLRLTLPLRPERTMPGPGAPALFGPVPLKLDRPDRNKLQTLRELRYPDRHVRLRPTLLRFSRIRAIRNWAHVHQGSEEYALDWWTVMYRMAIGFYLDWAKRLTTGLCPDWTVACQAPHLEP